MDWGLLAPETIVSTRRVRTLGVGAAVRAFNDLAVPGMGGVWYGKQLLLACLGIGLAEKIQSKTKITNIAAANAVEAAACWLAFKDADRDPRLRGRIKLSGKDEAFTKFATVRRPGFYVTQPMRMATVQPLLALGLVEGSGERFNNFHLTEDGRRFIVEACGKFRPNNRTVLDNLAVWADDQDCVGSEKSKQALSPLQALEKPARAFLKERLVVGAGSERRQSALHWMDTVTSDFATPMSWDDRPAEISPDHWDDLRAGAYFFAVRDAAIAWLDTIEQQIGQSSERRLNLTQPLPKGLAEKANDLKSKAERFLDLGHDPTPGRMATKLCEECITPDHVSRVRSLVVRDGRVLILRSNEVVPGPAFRGTADLADSDIEPDAEEAPQTLQPAWPDDISARVRNLYLFNLDLAGDLSRVLQSGEA